MPMWQRKMCTSVEIQGADKRECRVTNADEAESSRRPVDRSIDFAKTTWYTRLPTLRFSHSQIPPSSPPKRYQQSDKLQSGRQCAIATSESLWQPEAEGCWRYLQSTHGRGDEEAGSGGSVAADSAGPQGPCRRRILGPLRLDNFIAGHRLLSRGLHNASLTISLQFPCFFVSR